MKPQRTLDVVNLFTVATSSRVESPMVDLPQCRGDVVEFLKSSWKVERN